MVNVTLSKRVKEVKSAAYWPSCRKKTLLETEKGVSRNLNMSILRLYISESKYA